MELAGARDTQESLVEAVDTLHKILDSVPAVVFYKDLDLNVIFANQTASEAWGVPQDVLAQRSYWEEFGIETAVEFFTHEADIIRTGRPKRGFIERVDTPRGRRWFLVNKIPQKDTCGDVVGLMIFGIDISDIKRTSDRLEQIRELAERELDHEKSTRVAAERTLFTAEAKYRAIFENSGTADVVVNRESVVSLVNSRFETLAGLPRDQLLDGVSITRFLEPGEWQGLQAAGAQERDHGPDETHEARFTRADGQVRDVLVRSAIVPETDEMVVSLLDITYRNRALKALRESEERNRVMNMKMANGLVVLLEGRIAFVNQAFVSILEFDNAEEMEGRPLAALLEDADRDRFAAWLGAIQIGDSAEPYMELQCRCRGGDTRWTRMDVANITWKNRRAYLLTVRDITEQKARHRALDEAAQVLRDENARLKRSSRHRCQLGNIVGRSPSMREIYDLVLQAAGSKASVLITGESGTGKDLVARAIHDNSDRAEQQFVAVNCAAIPDNLLENEFFGHRRGAFTGAEALQAGFLDQADRGTLFLDEVVELEPKLQAKLLRAIEGGGYTAVGSENPKTSDFRLICATNQDVRQGLESGRVREDFFFRIQTIPMRLPALRDRKEDIPLLVESFVKQITGGSDPHALPVRVQEQLMAYDWPGNVRELRSVIERYLTVGRLDLPEDAARGLAFHRASAGHTLRERMSEYERAVIIEVLERNGWKRSAAASELGIDRKTLFNHMKRHGVESPRNGA